MFAVLTTLIAALDKLKIGNHFVVPSGNQEFSIPYNTGKKYVLISHENPFPNIYVYDKETNITISSGKQSFYQYSLFEIPAGYNVVAAYNGFNNETYILNASTVAILLYSKPVTCKITTNNGTHVAAGSPEELNEDVSESDSYFLGSELIVIKTNSTQNATITFKDHTMIPTENANIQGDKNLMLESSGSFSSLNEGDTIQASHAGLYTITAPSFSKLNISGLRSGYKLHCLACTYENNQVSKSGSLISFLVVKGMGNESNIVKVNNNSTFTWNSYDGTKYNNETDAKTTYFVSDVPIRLSFTKTNNVVVKASLSLDNIDNDFQIVNKDSITLYGQVITLNISGNGVLFINNIIGVTSLTDVTSSFNDNNLKTQINCIFLPIGSQTYPNINGSALFVVPDGCLSYIYTGSTYKEVKDQLNQTISQPSSFSCITTNANDLAIVKKVPDCLIKGKKLLFLSESDPPTSTVRSLLANEETTTTKSLKYYSKSASPKVSIIPSNATQNGNTVKGALAVLIEVTDESVIGFYEPNGYGDAQPNISNVDPGKQYLHPIVISENINGSYNTETTLSIVPMPDKKNILLTKSNEKYILSVIDQIQQVKVSGEYFIAVADSKTDHVSAIINPKQYTRKKVNAGYCFIIVKSSQKIDFNNVNGLLSKAVNNLEGGYKVIYGQLSSEVYLDFIGTSDGDEHLVNLMETAPALEPFNPKWDPTSEYDGATLSPGRYDIQLSSKIQTITIQASSMAFFVPKSTSDSTTIDVVYPLANKSVLKYNIFENKFLGYYFSSALQVELSGSSTLEIYIYSLTTQPDLKTVKFNRGGNELVSNGIGFVGFSNKSLCTITQRNGAILRQYSSVNPLSSNFIGDPFVIQGTSTVKYSINSMDNYVEETFTIPNDQGFAVEASQNQKDKGRLVEIAHDDGLSSGAKAGIAIAIILFIIIDVAIVLLVCYCRKHEPKAQYNFDEEEDLLEGDIEAEPMDENQQGADAPEDVPVEEENQ